MAKIKFFKRQGPVKYEFEIGIKTEFRAVDDADLMAWYRGKGVKIPPSAHKKGPNGVTLIDRKKLTPQQARDLEVDDDRFIAEMLVEISGLDGEDDKPLNWKKLPDDDRCEVIRSLREMDKKFNVFCGSYMRGGEKKSRRLAILAGDLEAD